MHSSNDVDYKSTYKTVEQVTVLVNSLSFIKAKKAKSVTTILGIDKNVIVITYTTGISVESENELCRLFKRRMTGDWETLEPWRSPIRGGTEENVRMSEEDTAIAKQIELLLLLD